MALEKTSKKTLKAASLSQSKAKLLTDKTKIKPTVGAAETAGAKTRRKSPAVSSVNSALQNGSNDASKLSGKVMAATAGHSGLERFTVESPIATETVSVGHSPAQPTRHGINRELIAQRAYFYWAERDYAHGSADEDWVRAEMDLIGRN